MPSLTDGQIKNAIKRVAKAQKPETLVDGEGRGTGRLVLVLKPHPTRVTSVWYAQQWQDGKRKLKKIGDYPHIPLAEARELFTRDFATAINQRILHQGAGRYAAGHRGGSVRCLL